MKRFLLKLKKVITLKKVLYFASLITFPLAGYLIGKGENLKMENPDIVIDTSQIDCGCGDQIVLEQDQPKQLEQEQFIASKNGQKYYPPGCASANRIKEENRVYYTSATEAEADGKELSSQCQ